jgi:hypothetical protein
MLFDTAQEAIAEMERVIREWRPMSCKEISMNGASASPSPSSNGATASSAPDLHTSVPAAKTSEIIHPLSSSPAASPSSVAHLVSRALQFVHSAHGVAEERNAYAGVLEDVLGVMLQNRG